MWYESEISVYTAPDKPRPRMSVLTIDLIRNVQGQIQGSHYKPEAEKIRAEKDPVKRKELKKQLPGVTLSGAFSYRDSENLTKHSGNISIDIDSDHNPTITDWEELRNTLGTWEEVGFSALSISGKGIFLIIPIKYPDKHLSHFKALQQDFKKMGIIIDKSCSDVARFRYMSFDEEAVFNQHARTYGKLYTPPPIPARTYAKTSDTDTTRSRVETIISKMNHDITTDYFDWFALGCSLANEFGEAGRGYFHDVSRFYPRYERGKTDKQYNNCMKNHSGQGYTIATFFEITKRHNLKFIES